MSGIVGIINWDGAPVDRRLLKRMTAALAVRGPDAQHTWVHGGVGLGHAWLQTTEQSAPHNIPYSLDGRVWITADARLDGRAELMRKLADKGCQELYAEDDAGLILHAYRMWREDCLQHLIGDFVFAIWDVRERHLFCARDQYGVKPFFYAQLENCLVFSNSLDCVRLHLAVSDRLNDQAIGDFLLFGTNQDLATSCFADIHRLPPAHYLAGAGWARLTRYWSLPINDQIRFRHKQEYVEQFQELLQAAVSDRLRGHRAGVLMSGGLDSTSVAATAKQCLSGQGGHSDLQAYTTVCDRLILDQERHYAKIAAEALGIPVRFFVLDGYRPFEGWDKPEFRRPEPELEPLLTLHMDQLHDAASHSRILLTGYGGDPTFRVTVDYPISLLTNWRLGQLAGEVWQYVAAHRRLPRVRLLRHLKRWLGLTQPCRPSFPGWLNPDFATRLDLCVRWEQWTREPVPIHPIRPEAYSSLTASDWPYLFESYDPGATSVPVEVRHPFFDLRLVNYLLVIPPLPWCTNKSLIRLTMHGLLPEAVRCRPKTVVARDPLVELLRREDMQWVDRFEPIPKLSAYVVRDRVPRVCGDEDSDAIWTNLRPLCLNHWLMQQL